MDIIGHTATTAGATTVTFSDIPQTFAALQLWVYKFNDSVDSAGGDSLRFNGSSTSTDYTLSYTQAYGTSRLASRFSNTGSLNDGYGSMGSGTRQPFTHIFDIYDYSSTTKVKQVIGFFGFLANSAEYSMEAGIYNGAYTQASTPITSLTYATSYGWAANCTFTLYGIRAS